MVALSNVIKYWIEINLVCNFSHRIHCRTSKVAQNFQRVAVVVAKNFRSLQCQEWFGSDIQTPSQQILFPEDVMRISRILTAPKRRPKALSRAVQSVYMNFSL